MTTVSILVAPLERLNFQCPQINARFWSEKMIGAVISAPQLTREKKRCLFSIAVFLNAISLVV